VTAGRNGASRTRTGDLLGAIREWMGTAGAHRTRKTVPVLPETRYARSGDVSIAYQVVGEGSLDLVWIPSMTHHVELAWESPAHARWLRRLASISRLIVFDKRGTGMSDRVVGAPALETRMDDIRAVMDAAGSKRAVLFGLGEGGPLCILFAATYPERTSALMLMNSSPRFIRSPDLPWLPDRADSERRVEEFERRWGEQSFHDEILQSNNPGAPDEERLAFSRIFRLSVSPGAAAAYLRMNLDVDVRDVLPLVRVPTLVLNRTEVQAIDVRRSGRYLAEHIPGARHIELPGPDFGPPFGDQESLFKALEEFLADVVEGTAVDLEPDRVLATVLFTDIVGATARAAELGDRAWRELLQKHHEMVRTQLVRFRGKEIDTAGDGFFATFDGSARAINCACAIRNGLAELGLAVRAGLHAGECELLDEKVGGIAVHIGARVAAQAQPDEILVSSTVKDLVAGSGLAFADRGVHDLKGIPGEWRLYAVER
jgi:class 3 adenylate cyclase/pimeloyl-ACP methyl ester carboxylesterase